MLGWFCSGTCLFGGLVFGGGLCFGGDVSYGFFVESFGIFFLAVGGMVGSIGPVLRLQERLEEIYGDGQDDGGVLVDGYLAHRLEQPQL